MITHLNPIDEVKEDGHLRFLGKGGGNKQNEPITLEIQNTNINPQNNELIKEILAETQMGVLNYLKPTGGGGGGGGGGGQGEAQPAQDLNQVLNKIKQETQGFTPDQIREWLKANGYSKQFTVAEHKGKIKVVIKKKN